MDKGNFNKIIIGSIIISITIVVLYVAWKFTAQPVEQEVLFDIQITADDHIIGASESAVILVEYSDFQCPACRSFAPVVNQVVDTYSNDLTFIYRHFPLQIHENSEVAAYAAEAAGNQNKFFEMYDMLFENQDNWGPSDNPKEIFTQYAKDLELDIDTFTKDMTSSKVKDKVQSDLTSGNQFGVNSTPSFYLNGQKLTISSYDQLEKAIQQAIEAH